MSNNTISITFTANGGAQVRGTLQDIAGDLNSLNRILESNAQRSRNSAQATAEGNAALRQSTQLINSLNSLSSQSRFENQLAAIARNQQALGQSNAAIRQRIDLERQLHQFMSANPGFPVDRARSYIASIQQAQDEVRRLSSTTSTATASMSSGFGSVKNALIGMFGLYQLKQLASDILNTNRSMEMLRAQLTSLTGSVSASKGAFDFIQKFAIETPFEIADVTKAYIMLQNYGIKPTVDVMSAITNQSAKLGASQDNLIGITRALGQAWAKGKLQGQEILQLVDQGVPIWDLLNQVTGKQSAELMIMSEKGELTRDVISKLIAKMGEMASGANANAMQTLNGKISNLSDSWHKFEDTLMGDKSEGFLKNIVTGLTDGIDKVTESIDNSEAAQIKRLERAIATQEKLKGSSFFVQSDYDANQAQLGSIKNKQLAAAMADRFAAGVGAAKPKSDSQAQVKEDTDLIRSRIDLLKVSGKLRESLELEATAIKGLVGEQAKEYVNNELAIEQLKKKTSAVGNLQDKLESINSGKYKQQLINASNKYGVDPLVALTVAQLETASGRNIKTSSGNAMGLMQMLPAAAKDAGKVTGYSVSQIRTNDPLSQGANIESGVAYLKILFDRLGKNATVPNVLAAYNGGAGALSKAGFNPALMGKEPANYSSSGSKIYDELVKATGATAGFAEAQLKAKNSSLALLDSITQETDMLSMSNTERARATELQKALTEANASDIPVITEALAKKWQLIDADERQQKQWEQLIADANAIDQLKDNAIFEERLVSMAKELKAQGLSNELIAQRIELERQVSQTVEQNAGLSEQEARALLTRTQSAQKSINDIVGQSSQVGANSMQKAYERAIENIHDSLANMFEGILNGDSFKNGLQGFVDSISKAANKSMANNMATWAQSLFSQSGSSGGSSSGSSGSGIMSMFGNMFGNGASSSAGGSSSSGFMSMFGKMFSGASGSSGGSRFMENITSQFGGSSFKGNGPLASYGNNAGGTTGAFSGASGMGWGVVGSIGNSIVGDWKPDKAVTNKTVLSAHKVVAEVFDFIGNFYPILKIVKPLANAAWKLSSALMPDRRPDLLGTLLLGPIGGMLFGSVPKAQSSYYNGASGTQYNLGNSSSGHGDLATAIQISKTSASPAYIKSLEQTLGVNIGGFTTNYQQHGRKSQFSVSDIFGELFNTGMHNTWRMGFMDQYVKEFTTTLVKHTVAQFVDEGEREVIRNKGNDSIKKITTELQKVRDIRLFEGTQGSIVEQFRQLDQQMSVMTDTAKKYKMSLDELQAAEDRAKQALKFGAQDALRSLAGLSPTVESSIFAVNQQLIAARANWAAAGFSVTEMADLTARTFANLREQTLQPFNDVIASIAETQAGLAGTTTGTGDIAAMMEALKGMTDPTDQLKQVNKIQTALQKRYDNEITLINKSASALNSITDWLNSLKLSNLSTLSPEQRLREAQGQYGTNLLKAQAGDVTAQANFGNYANQYLSEAQSYYGSNDQYAAIVASVQAAGELLTGGAKSSTDVVNAAQTATDAANQTLSNSLTSLSDILSGFVTTLGKQFDATAGTKTDTTTGTVTNAAGDVVLPAPGVTAKSYLSQLEDTRQGYMTAYDTAKENSLKGLGKDYTNEQKGIAAKAKNDFNGAQDAIKEYNFWMSKDNPTAAEQNAKDIVVYDNYALEYNKKSTSKARKDELKPLMDKLKKQLHFKADGGLASGNTVINEDGPEVLQFARPTMIVNNQKTQNLIAVGNDSAIEELKKQTAELTALVKANQALLAKFGLLGDDVTQIKNKTRLAAAK